ncbi:MAG TPA: OmpH family outer membrane protein [Cytophagaceae bacterium]|jgi:outer membrane protein|nr:OmpH family outer membrane protein [Cytophagaceae bacterium]
MKNEKLILGSIAVLFAIVIALSIVVFTKSEKNAYIDTSKLMEGSKEIQALKKQSQQEAEILKANADTLMGEFQEELKKYEKGLSKMSNKEKQLSMQLLETKRNQIIQYQQATQQKSQQEEQQKTQAIIANINKYIAEYGKEKGYKIIFATTNGNIAYAEKGMDITEEIIKGINGDK